MTQLRRLKVFLNASLSTLAEQRMNLEIAALLERLGFDYYSPQEHIPPGIRTPPSQILAANISAVSEADVILTVLDKPGLGVVFELGYAMAINKVIIALRTDKQDYLGKVVEGLWEQLEEDRKARTLEDLETVMEQLNREIGV